MKEENSSIFNKLNYIANSPETIKLYNSYKTNKDLSLIQNTEMKNSQIIIQEMQSSIDTIMTNLRKDSPNINTQNNFNYTNNKPHLYKTPNNILNKKIYNHDIPKSLDFNYKNHIRKDFTSYKKESNKYLFRNYSDYEIKNKILLNDNTNISIFNNQNSILNTLNTNNDNFKENINLILKNLKIIKENNIINKKEIILFKKEYYGMEKMLIKSFEEFFKLINKKNTFKINELENKLNEYKNKYNDLFKINSDINDNNIKEIKENKNIYESELNLKNKEIKEIEYKYEKIIKEQNEKLNELNLEIIKLNLEKKKLKHQQMKRQIENMNINIDNNLNNKKIKELELKNNEINILKHKSFEKNKISKNKTIKITTKPTISEIINQENLINNDFLSENKKLKRDIIILKSKTNNYMKLYFQIKEFSDKLILENKQLTKERDEYKKKKAELNNEIEIIKINNERMNNIKIKNNILINSNLTIKNKINNSKEKNNNKENILLKTNNNTQKKENKENKEYNNIKNKNTFKRSKSTKNKIKLNNNKIKDLSIINKKKSNINNPNNNKFKNLFINKEIIINLKGIENINKTNNINDEIKLNNTNILEENNKNKMIIEELKAEIKKKEQLITKYELEKQIAAKNNKILSDSNSYQINGLNELIKLLKEKNRKLNIENEELRNKTDERIIELVKELNNKDKEISILTGNNNTLKKELNNNGINITNLEN